MMEEVKAALKDAMRQIDYCYMEDGLRRVRPDICSRMFVVNFGNGYIDESMNTVQGLRDVECAVSKYLRGRCYQQFFGGQMEQVLDDMISISYIKTPAQVVTIIKELRKMGIKGRIFIGVEYVEGHTYEIKEI